MMTISDRTVARVRERERRTQSCTKTRYFWKKKKKCRITFVWRHFLYYIFMIKIIPIFNCSWSGGPRSTFFGVSDEPISCWLVMIHVNPYLFSIFFFFFCFCLLFVFVCFVFKYRPPHMSTNGWLVRHRFNALDWLFGSLVYMIASL